MLVQQVIHIDRPRIAPLVDHLGGGGQVIGAKIELQFAWWGAGEIGGNQVAFAPGERRGEPGKGVSNTNLKIDPEIVGERPGQFVFRPGRAIRPQVVATRSVTRQHHHAAALLDLLKLAWLVVA